MPFLYATLILFLIYASVVDIRERRIPNWLCGLILVLGMAGNSILLAPIGFYHSLVGLLIGFLAFMIMRSITGMGAGDVKLMAAVGATVGFRLSLKIVCFSILLSGLFAIAYLIVRFLVTGTLRYCENPPKTFAGVPVSPDISLTQYPLPMAPGITVATCYVLMPKLTPLIERFGY